MSVNFCPILIRNGQPALRRPPKAGGHGDREGPPLGVPGEPFDDSIRTVYAQDIEGICLSSAPRGGGRPRLDNKHGAPARVRAHGRAPRTAYMQVACEKYINAAGCEACPRHVRSSDQGAFTLTCGDVKRVMADNDLGHLGTERPQSLADPRDLPFVDPSALDR